MRIGQGYDVHRLVEGRKLIIGGVDIPYEKGLLGHSDADVLLHAVMDALLGAAALGDIGKLQQKWNLSGYFSFKTAVCGLVSAVSTSVLESYSTTFRQSPVNSSRRPITG